MAAAQRDELARLLVAARDVARLVAVLHRRHAAE
jgi:hypothetical protein